MKPSKLLLLGLSMLAMGGCARWNAKDAEKEWERADSIGAGSNIDRCKAATKAAEAWLQVGDEERILYWRVRRSVDCRNAELSHY